MTVVEVVSLIGHVDGFNHQMTDQYAQRLADHNVNGAVLASCDLSELKPVLQMAFGDWVLFRSVIETLRYHEQNAEPSSQELSAPVAACVRSTDVARNTPVGAAESATSSSKRATASDITLTSASTGEAVAAAVCRSSPALGDPPPPAPKSAERGDVTGRGDVTTDDVRPPPASSSSALAMRRQDSFVNEVLMESATLREFIQASVVGSDSDGGGNADSDDEIARPIDTIPEESSVISRNTSGSSLGRRGSVQAAAAAASVRRTSADSGPIDRAFSVGPDHDSGESDSEVERVSRRSSLRHAHGGSKQPADADPAAAPVSAEDKRKRFVAKSARPHDVVHHRGSLKHHPPDKSRSGTKLDRATHESSVPLMSLYFPMASDRAATSQGPGVVSPRANQPVAAQASAQSSHPSDGSPPPGELAAEDSCSVAIAGLPPEKSSPGPRPKQPASSAANRDAGNPATSPPTTPQPAESADGVSDSVKFFIVDESETSPKAIMLEMDSLRRVDSSRSTNPSPSSHSDHDNVQV